MDSLNQLQMKLLELSELFYNGLGVVQASAAPVHFADASAVPVSVAESGAGEAWAAQVEQQRQLRRTFAQAIAASSRSVDELADALPPLQPVQPAELRALMTELGQSEDELQSALDRAADVLKRVREAKESALKNKLEKRLKVK